jgi:hypothetical protein
MNSQPNREDDEIRFALGVLDDHRRLIAAGKTQRWDIVKWAVTVNVALAGASVTLTHQDANAAGLFWLLTLGLFMLSGSLMWEVTRRMTATRNATRAPEEFLSKQGIDLVGITGEQPPEKYEMNYDLQELRVYALILLASTAPALLVWLLALIPLNSF